MVTLYRHATATQTAAHMSITTCCLPPVPLYTSERCAVSMTLLQLLSKVHSRTCMHSISNTMGTYTANSTGHQAAKIGVKMAHLANTTEVAPHAHVMMAMS